MKRIGLFILLVFTWTFVQASEPFEGTIVFSISHESNHEKLPVEFLRATYGSAVTLSYKDGKRKMEWKDGDGEWEIYRSDANKLYFKLRSDDSIQVMDGAVETRELASFEDMKSSEVILGRETRKIVVKYGDGSASKYWYDPNIYINPEPFSEMRFAFYNKVWEAAESPWIKHERTTDTSRITYTATKINPEEISDDVFIVPAIKATSTSKKNNGTP